MSRRILSQIRAAIISGDYDLTFHAVEEMAEDNLTIDDVEAVVVDGELTKTELDDLRGPRYTIVGLCARKRRIVGVVGRFKETRIFLVVTVYEVS